MDDAMRNHSGGLPPSSGTSRIARFGIHIRKVIATVLFMIAPAPAGLAQSGSAALTLEAAWQLLDAHNLSLQQISLATLQAEEEIRIQQANFLPSLALTSSYNHLSEIARFELPIRLPGVTPQIIEAGVKDQYDAAVLVKQPLFTGFRTRNLVRMAEARARGQDLQKTALRQKLYFQVGQLFYSIQLNLLQQDVLQESINRAESQLRDVRNFMLAKQATAFDTLEIANRKLQASNQLENLRNVLRILHGKMRFVLNAPELPEISPMRTDTLQLITASLPQLQASALQQRPEYRSLQEARDAQRFQRQALKSAKYPQLHAMASYHYARPGVNFFENEWMDYYTVGVQMQWNLWDWKKVRRKVQQADLEGRKLDLELQNMQRRIAQEVEEAYHYLENARQQIVLQEKLVTQERERFRITREKYNQGVATALQLSLAESSLTQAELFLQEKYFQWLRYRLQLDYATGTIGK